MTTPNSGARDLDTVIATIDALQAAFITAVGVFTCPCGEQTEFTETSTLEDYAALNRWLGHHARCDLDGSLRVDEPVNPPQDLTEQRVREIVDEELRSADRRGQQVAVRGNDPRSQLIETVLRAVPQVLEALAKAASQPVTVHAAESAAAADPAEVAGGLAGARSVAS